LGVSSAAVWHEVECGGYDADLPVIEELARGREGRVLELGCGTGRVALHLAHRGQEVWGVDANRELLEALGARASAEGLAVRTVCADIRALDLDRDFALIVAPMQVLQMLGGKPARLAALERAGAHLIAGGRLAAAIVEHPAPSLDGGAAIPDIRERNGWTYSSLPVGAVTTDGGIEIHRFRQAVAPDGALSEEEYVEHLDALAADELEAEAAEVGLRPVERLYVPSTDGYLGSTVVVLEQA
jgi:SAM-dependent methyltransferase